MPKPKVYNPGDHEAMERLKGAPREQTSEKSERILKVYGSILLVICIAAALAFVGYKIYQELHSIGGKYQNAVTSTGQSMLTLPSNSGSGRRLFYV
ncbi:MAG TPA: hypothetical protein VFJ58_12255 [Armatimonadota bacterium]|nr:hypothetical protein [Armatimonadota bacterium]